jgi:predicted anti-sigma-YlaC factor YlaD
MSLTCREVFLRLSDYLDGDLARVTCQGIRRHLALCPNCRAFVNTLRKTIELCRKLPQYPVPPGVRRKLRIIIRSRLAEERTGIHRGG